MGNIKGSIRGPYKRREREKRYVCSCSFGKDSLATVLLALENGEPLDAVVYVEVMYDLDRGISGENPEHIKWVKEVAMPKLREMGLEVVHLRSDKDYMWCFHKEITRGSNIGKKRGFPIGRMCCIQRECKTGPIRKWYKEGYFKDGYEVVEYVGIAIDEPERLGSLDSSELVKVSKTSLLAKYGYTETMALLKCAEYGLLSPIYFGGGRRNGCWFCPNQSVSALSSFSRTYPELWDELRVLSEDPNKASECFRYNQTFSDTERIIGEYEEKYGKWLGDK